MGKELLMLPVGHRPVDYQRCCYMCLLRLQLGDWLIAKLTSPDVFGACLLNPFHPFHLF